MGQQGGLGETEMGLGLLGGGQEQPVLDQYGDGLGQDFTPDALGFARTSLIHLLSLDESRFSPQLIGSAGQQGS